MPGFYCQPRRGENHRPLQADSGYTGAIAGARQVTSNLRGVRPIKPLHWNVTGLGCRSSFTETKPPVSLQAHRNCGSGSNLRMRGTDESTIMRDNIRQEASKLTRFSKIVQWLHAPEQFLFLLPLLTANHTNEPRQGFRSGVLIRSLY
jgi:hypothetical protein